MNSKASTRFLSWTMYTFSSEPFRKQSLGRRANSSGGPLVSLGAYLPMQIVNQRCFPAVPFIAGIRFKAGVRGSLARRERNVNHPNTVVNDLAHRTNSTSRLFLILRLRAGALSHDFFQRTRKKHTFRSARPFPMFFCPAFARATPFTSNGSTFFTSKRVFHTHVTGSAKTDWRCARGARVFQVLSSGTATKAEITI